MKVIGLFLMGLMGVEDSTPAAGEAAWHWQGAHPVLSTHRCAQWLSPHPVGFRIRTRRPAGRTAQDGELSFMKDRKFSNPAPRFPLFIEVYVTHSNIPTFKCTVLVVFFKKIIFSIYFHA